MTCFKPFGVVWTRLGGIKKVSWRLDRVKQGLIGVLPLLAVVLSGCTSVDYVGQKLDPTPESHKVEYFMNRGQVPVGKYQIMGRASVCGPDGIDTYDIQELLLEKAHEFGADAVAVVGVRFVKKSIYPSSEECFDSPNPDSSPISYTDDGELIPIDFFGEKSVPLRSGFGFRNEVRVQALFLKDRQILCQLLIERGKESGKIKDQAVVEKSLNTADDLPSSLSDTTSQEESPVGGKSSDTNVVSSSDTTSQEEN